MECLDLTKYVCVNDGWVKNILGFVILKEMVKA